MTLIMLFVLLLLATLASWAGRRRLACGAGGLALLLFVAVAWGPLPYCLLHNLQDPYAATVSGSWAPRNAIVLLGAGTTDATANGASEPKLFAYGRIAQAAMLYRDCQASGQQCLLLVSGGDAQQHGTTEAAVYGDVLRRLGVPVQDQLLESRSRSTWQNAQFSRPLLQAYQPQRVLLVSSGIHLRRSMLYFAHFGLQPTPVRGDEVDAIFSVWPQSWNFALCDAALHEYLGIAQYHVYNVIGWNAPPVRAPIIPASLQH